MDEQFRDVVVTLGRIERLAEVLRADPDGYVHRSTAALRDAFERRKAIEPAVARVLDSVKMLRRHNRDGARREFQWRQRGLDHLEQVIAQDLLPRLRRIGFEV